MSIVIVIVSYGITSVLSSVNTFSGDNLKIKYLWVVNNEKPVCIISIYIFANSVVDQYPRGIVRIRPLYIFSWINICKSKRDVWSRNGSNVCWCYLYAYLRCWTYINRTIFALRAASKLINLSLIYSNSGKWQDIKNDTICTNKSNFTIGAATQQLLVSNLS